MRTKRFGIGSVLLLTILSGQVLAAGSEEGRLAMPDNQENGTARVISMGSAVVGLPQGSASVLWNPAGLGYLERLELGAHHHSGLVDTIQEMAVLGIPMGAFGGVAMNVKYVNDGTFDGRDAFGNPTGSYASTAWGVGFGWGKRVLSHLALGVTARFNSQNLATASYAAAGVDLGLLWTFDPITLGVTYTNFGTSVAGKLLDSGLRFGGSYRVSRDLVLAAASELKPVGGLDALRFGVEYDVFPMLVIRGGYVQNFTDQELAGITGVTAGLGLKFNQILLDYAVVPTGELGTSHRIGFTYQLAEEKKAVAVVKPEPVLVAPTIASLDPAHGPVQGGTWVLMTGKGLTGVRTVMFGDLKAVNFIVHSDSRMTAKAPPQAAGPVEVSVANVAGVSPPSHPYAYDAEIVPAVPVVVEIVRLIAMDDTFFEFDQSAVSPAGEDLLKQHIRVLKDNPELTICISGYTSSRGTEEYNLRLSERRANAVRDLLIQGGIAPDRLTAVGYGETRPATFEKVPSEIQSMAAKANMRVLFEIGVCPKP